MLRPYSSARTCFDDIGERHKSASHPSTRADPLTSGGSVPRSALTTRALRTPRSARARFVAHEALPESLAVPPPPPPAPPPAYDMIL